MMKEEEQPIFIPSRPREVIGLSEEGDLIFADNLIEARRRAENCERIERGLEESYPTRSESGQAPRKKKAKYG